MANGSPTLLARLGLALTAPRAAFAVADDPHQAGRAGTDLFAILIATVLVVHVRELFAAAWLGLVVEPKVGLRAGFDVLADGVTMPLAVLVIAAALLWGAAGAQRSIGRDFDLACVAVLPFLFVDLAGTLVMRLVGHTPPRTVFLVIAGVWALGLVVVGVRQARTARPEELAAPTGGRPAGLALAAVTAALLVVNATWIVRHLDWLKPTEVGDPAPPFLLATVDAEGELDAPVRSEDLLGQVVVLDFWATWCRPCLQALPAMSELAARGEVTVLSIVGDDPVKARALFDENGYRQVLVTDDGTAADRYGVDAIPHMVVIDRDGKVRLVSRGDGDLRRVIDVATDLARN